MFPTLGPRLATIIRLKIQAKRAGREPTTCIVADDIVEELGRELSAINATHPDLRHLTPKQFVERIRDGTRLKFDGLQVRVARPGEIIPVPNADDGQPGVFTLVVL